MLQAPRTNEVVTRRIERAYLRRRPQWRQINLDSRVWSAAFAVLEEANRVDPRAPLDPELFVACLSSEEIGCDPWTELTRTSSLRRYLSRVRAMIRLLRAEIKAEVARMEALLRKGEDLEVVVVNHSRKTSPISRYLVAVLHHRGDLADLLRDAAQHQHWSCPLYRDATKSFFPDRTYPVGYVIVNEPHRFGFAHYSLN